MFQEFPLPIIASDGPQRPGDRREGCSIVPGSASNGAPGRCASTATAAAAAPPAACRCSPPAAPPSLQAMAAAQDEEVEGLGRVLTRLALTDDDKLEQARFCWGRRCARRPAAALSSGWAVGPGS